MSTTPSFGAVPNHPPFKGIPMKMFSTDLLIAGTLYVNAENEEEAREKIKSILGTGIEFSNRRQQVSEDLHVTGETYSPDMPMAFSPAMTVLEDQKQDLPLEVVEDFNPEAES